MLKAYCYRIYPTNVQQQILRMQFGAVRFVYNYFLAERQDQYEKKEPHLSFFDLCHKLVELKQSDDRAWLYRTNAQSLCQSLKNLDAAYQNFFQKRAGHPRFKSRRNGHQSMAYPQGAFVEGNHLHIPKLGRVSIRLSRPFSGTMKTVTLKKTPTHKYYVSILVDDQHPLPKPIQELNLVSGVDVAWGEFVRQLEYKCRWAGKHLVRVDRFYPSSKTCAECSTKNEELTLKERIWTCADCGVALDRDANAAQNIRVAGMHKMSEAGYVFVNRGEDVRLRAWSFLALLRSVQQSSMKRVGRTTRSSSEMAQFSN